MDDLEKKAYVQFAYLLQDCSLATDIRFSLRSLFLSKRVSIPDIAIKAAILNQKFRFCSTQNPDQDDSGH